jgi:flagellar L-ring protein precursor FlgH
MRNLSSLILAAMILAGCAATPSTGVHQPMSVRPANNMERIAANGSIFQANAVRPLFEDRRARYIGDTMTVNIVENTAASLKSSSSATSTGSTTASVGAITGVPNLGLPGLGVNGSHNNTFSGKGDSAATNVITGTITVTVIETLGNGNLLVSGEKQVAIGQGQEFIRLSGVVNPYTISSANTVNSTQIADARVEYKSSGYISEAQMMGWLARFFLSVLPF